MTTRRRRCLPADPDSSGPLAGARRTRTVGRCNEAVDNLEAAIPTTDPAEVYAIAHKALASALKVIARADDSSGIIGGACRRLLELHPTVAAAAQVPAGSLAEWMVRFQFDGDVDYFALDRVAYAPALGKSGMATYRARLSNIGAALGHGLLRRTSGTSPRAADLISVDVGDQAARFGSGEATAIGAHSRS